MLQQWKEKFHILAMAVTFAEAGDPASADNLIKDVATKVKHKRVVQRKTSRKRPRIHIHRS